MSHQFVVCTLAITLFAVPVLAQNNAAENSACVADNIDWVLPGHFADALQRGKSEQRLILIKGVSFGIDVAGAACATKGKW